MGPRWWAPSIKNNCLNISWHSHLNLICLRIWLFMKKRTEKTAKIIICIFQHRTCNSVLYSSVGSRLQIRIHDFYGSGSIKVFRIRLVMDPQLTRPLTVIFLNFPSPRLTLSLTVVFILSIATVFCCASVAFTAVFLHIWKHRRPTRAAHLNCCLVKINF